MVLTNERAEMIANYLKEDVDRANKMSDLSPEEAAKVINANGYDFSAEEIKEFAENLKKVAAQGDELNEENLDEVAGGVIAAAAATVYLACITIGIGLGTAAAAKWKW